MRVEKGTVGVWNGTLIRLFRVQAVEEGGPTLSSPRGAVDAVGSNIVSRIGGLSLRSGGAGATGTGGDRERDGGAGGGGGGNGSVREARTGTGTPGTPLGGRSAVI